MRYTVVWTTTAENELAQLWLEANDRPSVTDAADRLDVELGTDPLRSSIVTSDLFREMTLLPLVIRFSFSELDRRVSVVSVWRRHT